MEYPEEIYENRQGHPMTKKQIRLSGWAREKAYELGHDAGYWKGYEAGGAGKAKHPGPIKGYSNLTAAIKDNKPIDWNKLDGLKVQCLNPVEGARHGTLKRDSRFPPERPSGWWNPSMDSFYISALTESWNGENGCTLYIEGDIPMRRKTAYELEVGTYFLGEVPGYMAGEAYVGGEEFGIGKRVHRAPSMIESTVPASEWIVLEEYGTSPKPEDK